MGGIEIALMPVFNRLNVAFRTVADWCFLRVSDAWRPMLGLARYGAMLSGFVLFAMVFDGQTRKD